MTVRPGIAITFGGPPTLYPTPPSRNKYWAELVKSAEDLWDRHERRLAMVLNAPESYYFWLGKDAHDFEIKC